MFILYWVAKFENLVNWNSICHRTSGGSSWRRGARLAAAAERAGGGTPCGPRFGRSTAVCTWAAPAEGHLRLHRAEQYATREHRVIFLIESAILISPIQISAIHYNLSHYRGRRRWLGCRRLRRLASSHWRCRLSAARHSCCRIRTRVLRRALSARRVGRVPRTGRTIWRASRATR